MIRRVGIDFGTSTTVVRVKNYENDGKTYIHDRLGSQVVMFGDYPTVPTLARRLANGKWIWGHEAVKDYKGSTLYQNFKMSLCDPERQEEAQELTRGFFKYLYACFEEQDSVGSFGDEADRIETIISYPVKWQSDDVEFLLQAAHEAGFKNITHMNEAKAAVISALQQYKTQLSAMGLRREGDKIKLLLVDMGAGTTDFVVGEYTYSETAPQWRMISCWPIHEGAATCGGREIDLALKGFIADTLRAYGQETGETEMYMKMLESPKRLPAIKAWKERDVSDELDKGGVVTECEVMVNCAGGSEVPFEPIDRGQLEKILGKFIGELAALANGCIENDPEKQTPIEAVVLVGGSSRWYFVPELFAGWPVAGKRIVLNKIQSMENPESRILRLVRPQETVAQGLVLSALPLEIEGDSAPMESQIEQESEKPAAQPVSDSGEQENTGASGLSAGGLQKVLDALCLLGKMMVNSNAEAVAPGEKRLPVNKGSIIAKMCTALKLPKDEAYYYCNDASLLNNGGTGFIIGEKGIIGRYLGKKVTVVSWEKIAEGGFEMDWSSLFYYDKPGVRITFGVINTGSSERDRIIAEDIMTLVRSLTPADLAGAKGEGGASSAAPAKSAETVQAGGVKSRRAFAETIRDLSRRLDWPSDKCNAGLGTCQFRIQVERTMLSNFIARNKLPADIEYFIWHDESMFENGKGEGFAVSEKGLHIKAFWTPYRFISWREIARAVASNTFDVSPAAKGINLKVGSWENSIYLWNNFPSLSKEKIEALPNRLVWFLNSIKEVLMYIEPAELE